MYSARGLIEVLAVLKTVNRYILVIGLGLFVALILLITTAYIWWDDIVDNPSDVRVSFFMSLLGDVVFFGLVGLTMFIHQIYASRGDILRKRVEYLFANSVLSSPAVEYIEKIVKRNALYSVETIHRVEVLEYNREYRAYRVAFHNRYRLRNMFGDHFHDEKVAATVAPDLIRDEIRPLGEVISVRLTDDSGTEEFIHDRVELTEKGFKKNVQVRLSPDAEATFEMQWWSWATNTGNSGFSVRRFSEHTSIEIVNKSNVTARVFLPERRNEIFSLRYMEELTLRDRSHVPEMERLDFQWLPPEEFIDEPGPTDYGSGIHPILLERDKL